MSSSRPQTSRMSSHMLMLVLTVSVVVMGVAHGRNLAESPSKSPEAASVTLASVASGIPDLSTLVAAVKASPDLLKAATDPQTAVTVFAPTNEAFAAALKKWNITSEKLLSNQTLVTKLLSYHIVPKVIFSSSITGPTNESTLLKGKTLKLDKVGGVFKVNNVTVTKSDVSAGKSVIQIINKVLWYKHH